MCQIICKDNAQFAGVKNENNRSCTNRNHIELNFEHFRIGVFTN